MSSNGINLISDINGNGKKNKSAYNGFIIP